MSTPVLSQPFSDTSKASAISEFMPLAGRVLMAAIFLISGSGKIFAPAATIGFIASAGLPLPTVAYGIAVFIEIAGGTALILGYRTRIVAAVMAVFCFATAFGFHAHFADQNQFIHFFKNMTMAGGFLQVMAFGAGRVSLDAKSGRE
jgi:putative oxidoreductase